MILVASNAQIIIVYAEDGSYALRCLMISKNLFVCVCVRDMSTAYACPTMWPFSSRQFCLPRW